MKAYVDDEELYPCYVIKKEPHSHEVDVPEETILKWKKIHSEFFQAQEEIRRAIIIHEFKQEEITHLKQCFANPNPSRTDKGYVLKKFGWIQRDTSLWDKDGRHVRLHEAYNECKQEFEKDVNESV